MPRITTVIFDMYETLVQNPFETGKVSFAKTIEEQGLNATVDDLWAGCLPAEEEFRNTRVDPDRPFQSYFSAWKGGFEQSFAKLKVDGDAQAATEQFFRHLSKRSPFPETDEALAEVQKRCRIALLSNADDGFLLPNLELLEVGFETVLSSEQAQMYKPRPELFQVMLGRLGVSPQETAYVGDRQLEDVLGPSQAGMHPIWINRENRPLDPALPTPAHQISSLLELPKLLAKDLAN
ncbi:MAG: HAD family hydrolase [Chloroflexi bacterium]|nr:HAD family hydrolase [Chloroflexota bacterium]